MNQNDLALALQEPRHDSPHPHAWLTLAAGHAPRGEVLAHPSPQPVRSSLFVRRLRMDARIGVYDWEKAAPQPLLIDLEFDYDAAMPGTAGRLQASFWLQDANDVGIGGGDLDHRQHVGHAVHSGAAVFDRHLDAHQPVFTEGADVFERKLPGPVMVLRAGCDLLAGDAAGHILQHPLLFAEAKFHDCLVTQPESVIVARRAGEPQPLPRPQSSSLSLCVASTAAVRKAPE